MKLANTPGWRRARPFCSVIALVVYGITAWTIWQTLELTNDGRYVGELGNLARFLVGGVLGLGFAVASLVRRERCTWFSLLMLVPAMVFLLPLTAFF